MSTTKFKIASKFKTEKEKKAEENAILEAAWDAVPSFEEVGPRVKIMSKTAELLEEERKKSEIYKKCDFYNTIMERILNG